MERIRPSTWHLDCLRRVRNNNKYFYPVISNTEYVKLAKLETLPALKNSKAYREKINRYGKKIQINEAEKRKYSDMIENIDKPRDSSTTRPSNKADEIQSQNNSCTLTIEVVKAWSSATSNAKLNVLPVVEIQKICEYENDFHNTYYTNIDNWNTNDNHFVWSQVFNLDYPPNVSNVYKKFKISLFQKEKGTRNVQIGQSYTISVLSNLDDQGVTFKTFEFGNEYDSLQWYVSTRIQYIYHRHELYKHILWKIDERQSILEDILQKYRKQRDMKLSRRTNRFLSQRMSDAGSSKNWLNKTSRSKVNNSQWAGYYSSAKSATSSMERKAYPNQQSFEVHSALL